ncbi:hypothetical protein [Desulfosporosinus sp. SB140]|uniref:hypothetical protein n=1 Tax=Desulfosporosinus paludis TaxID=3115649 RepID=UPI00388ED917
MTKNERACLLRKLKPLTWYYFCQMEALNPGQEVPITKKILMEQLMIGSTATLNKYLEIWESHRMVRRVQGGFLVAQLDGGASGISETPIVRQFKNSREIINYWCDLYQERYGRSYVVNNWSIATNQVNKLLIYPDEEIKGTLEAIISLYDKMWANQQYPRPTLGQVCSWLYAQAQPYAAKQAPGALEVTGSSQDGPDLLDELESKGWI